MRGDPEVLNKECQDFWDKATGVSANNQKEIRDELDLDARNVLKELKRMYDEDECAGDMEDILVSYLVDKGYKVIEPWSDEWCRDVEGEV